MAEVVRHRGADGIRWRRCRVAFPGRCPVSLRTGVRLTACESGVAPGRQRAAGPRKPWAPGWPRPEL